MTRALIPPESVISSPELYDRDFLLWIEAMIDTLRSAQLEMFNSRSWVAPYYWAAFTLQKE